MVDGPCDQQFLYIVVTSRGQVDVLAVPGFLFVENFLDKELDCMAEILFAQTVLFGGNHRSVYWFWVEFM
jgi:predicted phosphodiesterase